MVKWFFIAILMVGACFLVNAYIPQAWASGFKLPIGEKGFHVPWAVCLLGGLLIVAGVKINVK